jgi:methylthioribose-1-phosphate isomerase
MIQTITWTGSAARLLDQTMLPSETVYVEITDEKQMWDAIKRLVIRGAPAIGVAAAFGVYLGVRNFPQDESADIVAFSNHLDSVCGYLKSSRPTAVNLAWAVDRVRQQARVGPKFRASSWQLIGIQKQRILDESLKMLEEDTAICRALGEHGLTLLKALAGSSNRPIEVLTHCNAGGLATVQYGTALAPIYVGAERGLKLHVWADETRPLLQGSRITAYELQHNGVPVTVICDGMAASVMSQGKVDAVIVGTDRVAANGDVANKIGTLGVAILAKHFGVPFYVAAPTSSIDMSLPDGSHIPIEQRDPAEVTRGLGRQTAPDGIDVYNPAFDVTPANLVTAIITENGVAMPPYGTSLQQIMKSTSRDRRERNNGPVAYACDS